MISEATPVCVSGHGYPCTPGVHTQEQARSGARALVSHFRRAADASRSHFARSVAPQVDAWKPVVQAVHDKGAFIFCQARPSCALLHTRTHTLTLSAFALSSFSISQLWHVGRASHESFQAEGGKPVAPSAIAITGDAWTVYSATGEGPFPYPEPRALEEAEIAEIVAAFATAAKNAIAAGFDGVEIHSANGYLLQQFLADSTNTRTDGYGGSVEARARFTLEVVDAVVAAVGADKVGIRLAPFNFFLSCTDSDPAATYGHLMPKLSERKLAYVHLIEARQFEATPTDAPEQTGPFRAMFSGPAILAGGFERESGAAALAASKGDAIAYGRHYLANPDLPKRFALKAELNAYDRDTFYNPMFPIKGCVTHHASRARIVRIVRIAFFLLTLFLVFAVTRITRSWGRLRRRRLWRLTRTQ
jgi:N-ethylmaleimide reductase